MAKKKSTSGSKGSKSTKATPLKNKISKMKAAAEEAGATETAADAKTEAKAKAEAANAAADANLALNVTEVSETVVPVVTMDEATVKAALDEAEALKKLEMKRKADAKAAVEKGAASWSTDALASDAIEENAKNIAAESKAKDISALAPVNKAKEVIDLNVENIRNKKFSFTFGTGTSKRKPAAAGTETAVPAAEEKAAPAAEAETITAAEDTVTDSGEAAAPAADSGSSGSATDNFFSKMKPFLDSLAENYEKYAADDDAAERTKEEGDTTDIRNDFSVIADFSLPYHIEDDCGCGANCENGEEEDFLLTVPVPPIARDDFAFTGKNNPVHIWPSLNDKALHGDALVIDAIENGTTINTDEGGTAVGIKTYNAQSVYAFAYTPKADFIGTDSFEYTVKNRVNGLSDTAMVFIRVAEKYKAATLRVVDEAGNEVNQFCSIDDTIYTIDVNTGGRDVTTLNVINPNNSNTSTDGIGGTNGAWTFTPYAQTPGNMTLQLIDTSDSNKVLDDYVVSVVQSPEITKTSSTVVDPLTYTENQDGSIDVLVRGNMTTNYAVSARWNVEGTDVNFAFTDSVSSSATFNMNAQYVSSDAKKTTYKINSSATAQAYSGAGYTGCSDSSGFSIIHTVIISNLEPVPDPYDNYPIADFYYTEIGVGIGDKTIGGLINQDPDFKAAYTVFAERVAVLKSSPNAPLDIYNGNADPIIPANVEFMKFLELYSPQLKGNSKYWRMYRAADMLNLIISSIRSTDVTTLPDFAMFKETMVLYARSLGRNNAYTIADFTLLNKIKSELSQDGDKPELLVVFNKTTEVINVV